MKKSLLFLYFLAGFLSLYAQEKKFLGFTYYSTEQGLGSSNVHKIKVDKFGFAWIATQDGLYRFDGIRFISYNKTEEKKHHIAGADIKDLLFQGDTLWVVTSYGGLNAINLITGNVIYELDQQNQKGLSEVLFVSLAMHNTNVYIGSDKGLYILNTKDLSFSKITLSPDISPDQPIHKLIVKGNNIWIFCPFLGIVVWNLRDNKVIDIYKINISNYYDCCQSPSGILVGTNTGLYRFRLFDQKINRVPFSQDLPSSLTEGIVFSVASDTNNAIWLSTNQHVFKIDSSEKKYETIKPGKIPQLKDWTNSVFGIFLDSKSNIWLSTQEGVAFAPQRDAPFICYQKSLTGNAIIRHSYSIFPYSDTTLYVCAEDGLYSVNLNSFVISPKDLGRAYFFAFQNFDNNLIVSNENNTYIKKQNTLIPFQKYYPEFGKYEPLVLNSFIKLNDTCFILSSQNERGILTWNPQAHTVINIDKNSQGCKLPDNDINTVFKLNDTSCLVLASNSISIYNPTKSYCKEIVIKNLLDEKKYSLFFDIAKVGDFYFLSSYGSGILVLDTDFRFIKNLSTKEGLANNGVYKIFGYKDSLVFATTNNGLSQINIDNWFIKNYYGKDGIHSNVFEELSGSIRNEIIYAGGVDGFTAIHLNRLTTNTLIPSIIFTNITMTLDDKIIDTADIKIKSLQVSHKTKQTTIFFTSLNFSNPENSKYYYRIPQIQTDWLSNYNQNFITLIGLSPGTYTLQVKAINGDGVESEIKELTLLFLPKWYQTWWFKLLIVTMAIGIIYGLYRIRINQLKKEQQIKTRLARDLHDDLGSTMNSVKVYTNLALMEKEQQKYLGKIKESMQEAITGIKDMIWVLDDSKGSIEDLLSRVSLFASPLCEANTIQYKQEITDEARDHKLGQEERRNLYMILKEAINNAIKYAESRQIIIAIAVKRGKPEISIKDDGKGFDMGKRTEGNGLKNMNRRAKEIKYHIKIEAMPGKGTNISFQKI